MEMLKRKEKLWAFWQILNIFGIKSHKSERKENIFRKKSSLCFIIFYSISLSYTFAAYLKEIIDDWEESKSLMIIFGFIELAATILLYFVLLRRNGKLKILRKLLSTFQTCNRATGFLVLLYIDIFLSVIQIVSYVAVYEIFNTEDQDDSNMYILNHTAFGDILRVVGFFLRYFVEATVVTVLNCVFCAICYHWVKIISSVRKEIENKGTKCFYDCSQEDVAKCLLRKCVVLWEGTELIKDAFSPFLFCLVLKQVLAIYNCYAEIMKGDLDGTGKVEYWIHITELVIHFTVTVYLASRIPEEMEELVKCLIHVKEILAFKHNDTRCRLLYNQMELIIQRSPIVLTAGGFADMKKSLIFLTFGSLLTYGVLVYPNM